MKAGNLFIGMKMSEENSDLIPTGRLKDKRTYNNVDSLSRKSTEVTCKYRVDDPTYEA